jgi:phage repressor protein C with HTH and peptisase S24 domain
VSTQSHEKGGIKMLSHSAIWGAAIDALAERHQLTPSRLASRAGLDKTSFNRSKRFKGGRERWPSTESLAKVLECTGASVDDLLSVITDSNNDNAEKCDDRREIPLLGFAQAGSGGYFDEGGFPAGQEWDAMAFPAPPAEHGVYALEVQGESMMPLYRDGDRLIVEPGTQVRRGDKVVLKSRDGEVMAKVLARQSQRSIELLSLNPEHPNRTFEVSDVEWIARIIWASQ